MAVELTAKHLQGECQQQGKDLSEEVAALDAMAVALDGSMATKPATKDARRETNGLLPGGVKQTASFQSWSRNGGFSRAWIGPREHPSKPGSEQFRLQPVSSSCSDFPIVLEMISPHVFVLSWHRHRQGSCGTIWECAPGAPGKQRPATFGFRKVSKPHISHVFHPLVATCLFISVTISLLIAEPDNKRT